MNAQRGQLLSFFATLDIEPPGTTHHRKRIGQRQGGGMRLFDAPELKAARDALGLALVATGKTPRRPLRGPMALAFEFCFATADAWQYHTKKPDHDNLVKTLQDVLAEAGWIEQDEGVSICLTAKFLRPGRGSITVMARELEPPPAPITMVLDGLAIWDLGPT